MGLRTASCLIAAVPPGSGQGKLAGPLFHRLLRAGYENEMTVRMRSGARLALRLADPPQAQAFLTREYEAPVQRFLDERLGAGGVLVDVGAHIGLISISAASRGRDRGVRVHSFEPDPENCACLRRNLALNPGLQVTINEAALGDSTGNATFVRSIDSGDRSLGRVTMDGASAPASASLRVPVMTLDDYVRRANITRVDVLKIDAEGFEPAVLAGAVRSLSRELIGCVIAEVNESCLRKNGWESRTIYHQLAQYGYEPEPIPPLGLRRRIPRKGMTMHNEAFRPRTALPASSRW